MLQDAHGDGSYMGVTDVGGETCKIDGFGQVADRAAWCRRRRFREASAH